MVGIYFQKHLLTININRISDNTDDHVIISLDNRDYAVKIRIWSVYKEIPSANTLQKVNVIILLTNTA